MKPIVKTLLTIASFSLLFASCSGEKNKEKEQPKSLDALNVEDVIFDYDNMTINYKIPSPLEMFVRMSERNVAFDIELPNKINNATRYVTQYQQATNIGVYASDMAYCCIVGNSQNTLSYFNLVKNLSIEMGLYEGINKELADRVLDNLSETDTLISVTSESYHEVVNYIEEQGLVDIQCLVVAGAWIESLYLCLTPMKSQPLGEAEMELIHDHQILLENLIELLSQNKQSGNVAKLLEELLLIQSVYDIVYQNEGKILTQQQFANIVNTVSDVRAKIIK